MSDTEQQQQNFKDQLVVLGTDPTKWADAFSEKYDGKLIVLVGAADPEKVVSREDLVGWFQPAIDAGQDIGIAAIAALETRMIEGMEKLGYPANGGPEDADIFDKALLALTGVQSDRDALGLKVDDLRGQRDALQRQVDGLTSERDKLAGKVRDMTAAGKTASKATTKPAAKTRAIAPMATDPDRASMAALFQWPGPFTVVASDGKRSVAGLPETQVTGDEFLRIGDAYRLRHHISFTPDTDVAIAGFGLLGTDEKQVAYMALPEPVTIPAGRTFGFADAIAF